MYIKVSNLKPGDKVEGLFQEKVFKIQAVFPAPLSPGHFFVIMYDSECEPDRNSTFHTDLSCGTDSYFVSERG